MNPVRNDVSGGIRKKVSNGMKKKNYSIINNENADEICARISEESGEDIQKILGKAHKERERILLEAGKEAQIKTSAIITQADKEIERLKENIFSTINMEKKKIILNMKNKFIEDVMAAVTEESKLFRSDKNYPEFFKKAVMEGLRIVDDPEAEVIYSSLDNNFVTAEFKKEIIISARAKIRPDISVDFKNTDYNDIGVIVQSKSGRVFFDNRFSARLKRAYEGVYVELLKGA